MVRKLFHLFIFFAPFTSFFALSGWLRIPVIINQILFIITFISILIYGKLKIKWLVKEDLLLLCFLILVWVSFSLGFKEKRSFNHTLAYTNAVLFFFFLSKYVITHLKITSKEISRTIFYSFALCSFIILIDFLGKNLFDFSLRNLFSVKDGKISNMDYYIRSGFKRVGGVAEEPGTMSLFYNIYFGISLYFLRIKKQFNAIFFWLFIFVFCHFSMFSNAGIVLSILVSLFVFLREKIILKKISKKQLEWALLIILLLLIFISVFFLFNIGNIRLYFINFLNKTLFNEAGTYSSSGQRLFQWKRALLNFIQSPIFGYGPGFGVHEDKEGYLSVYFTILADIGIISFLFFLSFQEVILKKAIQLSNKIRPFILFSLFTSFLHLCIVSDFYHAPVWILICFIQLVFFEQKKQKKI